MTIPRLLVFLAGLLAVVVPFSTSAEWITPSANWGKVTSLQRGATRTVGNVVYASFNTAAGGPSVATVRGARQISISSANLIAAARIHPTAAMITVLAGAAMYFYQGDIYLDEESQQLVYSGGQCLRLLCTGWSGGPTTSESACLSSMMGARASCGQDCDALPSYYSGTSTRLYQCYRNNGASLIKPVTQYHSFTSSQQTVVTPRVATDAEIWAAVDPAAIMEALPASAWPGIPEVQDLEKKLAENVEAENDGDENTQPVPLPGAAQGQTPDKDELPEESPLLCDGSPSSPCSVKIEEEPITDPDPYQLDEGLTTHENAIGNSVSVPTPDAGTINSTLPSYSSCEQITINYRGFSRTIPGTTGCARLAQMKVFTGYLLYLLTALMIFNVAMKTRPR
jgi:hypothetical protein